MKLAKFKIYKKTDNIIAIQFLEFNHKVINNRFIECICW